MEPGTQHRLEQIEALVVMLVERAGMGKEAMAELDRLYSEREGDPLPVSNLPMHRALGKYAKR